MEPNPIYRRRVYLLYTDYLTMLFHHSRDMGILIHLGRAEQYRWKTQMIICQKVNHIKSVYEHKDRFRTLKSMQISLMQ